MKTYTILTDDGKKLEYEAGLAVVSKDGKGLTLHQNSNPRSEVIAQVNNVDRWWTPEATGDRQTRQT